MSTLRPEVDLAELDRRSAGRFPGFVGMHMVSVQAGRVAMRLVLRPEHLAPNGYLHAAVVVALADTACGYGTLAHLPQGASSFTTVELKSNFLGTARDGAIVCDASAAHLGRSTQVWDAEVRAEADGRRLALFRCTQIVLWPRSPQA
ncbi:MAG: PaaI family thioesterase [Burkholderiales bacterium]|nr:PaaI family thioesterase [Burkholderiales bacterium]